MRRKLLNLFVAGIISVCTMCSGINAYAQEQNVKHSGEVNTYLAPAAEQTVTIYRLYNRINGEHLYTSDAHEKDVLYKEHGWGYEGEAWYAPSKNTGKPVYRLYNAGLQNHLYTTDTNEVKVLTTRHGWVKDNNGRPVFYSGGNAKIYRMYNPALRGLHHWTTDTNEYNVLPRHGWTQEGVKLSAVRVGKPIRTKYYSENGIPTGSNRIDNTASKYTIEADVTLNGSGTGQHAKLVIASPTSAVSFGLQYDVAARAPHTNKTSFMVENISSNNAGGQNYQWTGHYANKGTSYRLMLTLQADGNYAGYINGAKVISGRNTALAGRTDLALRVEGAARKSGDTVTATFANIKLKNGTYSANRLWTGTPRFNISNGLVTKFDGKSVSNNPSDDRTVRTVVITGGLTGLAANADWDTAGYFDKVSGLVQFY